MIATYGDGKALHRMALELLAMAVWLFRFMISMASLLALQYINHSGDKQYHSKGKTQGGFVIGDLKPMGFYILLRFATAATITKNRAAMRSLLFS